MLAAGDIYWEGEEDNVNEFLEVKEDDPGVIGHLKRFKRQFSFPDFGEYNTYFLCNKTTHKTEAKSNNSVVTFHL